MTVHPRVCGERERAVIGDVVGVGSSPRVRGTRFARAARRPDDRFIPACAGNAHSDHAELRRDGRFIPACAGNATRFGGHRHDDPGSSPRVRGTPRSCMAACVSAAVHPRVCGERSTSAPLTKTSDGSSPRVRGTLVCRPSDRVRARFIPACAGNAADQVIKVAHPGRFIPACAGNARRSRRQGIAPRFIPACAGNAHGLSDISDIEHRFIPACAGNAASSDEIGRLVSVHPRVCGERTGCNQVPLLPAVHPRVCGERSDMLLTKILRGGSSPRVRGTQGRLFGIVRMTAVHPRVCGERKQPATIAMNFGGSSPRVRGTLTAATPSRSDVRFIPACAGNAWRSRSTPARRSVHPRVCGERSETAPRNGSRCRFIPACAGNAGSTSSGISK